MSQGYPGDPNNPFNQAGNSNIPDPYGMSGPPNPYGNPSPANQPYATNPYGSNTSEMYPPPPPNSGGKTLLYVLGGIGAVFILGCCGMYGLFYFFAEIGFNDKSNQLKQDFANHPRVQEELGGLSDVKHSWTGTISEEAQDDLVFEAQGPKGKGQLIVTEEGFSDEQTSVRLRTSKGEWELLDDPE